MENLNEEILKIREMMGLKSKTLLTESIGDEILDLLKNAIDKIKKSTEISLEYDDKNIVYRYKGTKIDKSEYYDIKKFIKDELDFDSLSNNVKKLFITELKNTESYNKLLDDIYIKEFSKIWKDEKVDEITYLLSVKDWLSKNNNSYENFIKKQFGDLTDIEKGIIEDIYQKKIKDLGDSMVNKTNFNKVSDEVLPGKKLKLSDDQIKKLASKFDNNKMLWDEFSKAFREYFKGDLKSVEKEIEDLGKSYFDTLSSAIEKGNFESIENIKKAFSIKLSEKLKRLNAIDQGAAKTAFYGTLENPALDIPSELKTYLSNSDGQIWKELNEVFEQTSINYKDMMKLCWEETKVSGEKMIRVITTTLKTAAFWKKANWGEFFKMLKETDVLLFFTTNQWLSFKRYFLLASKYGWKQNKLQALVMAIFMSFVGFITASITTSIIGIMYDLLMSLVNSISSGINTRLPKDYQIPMIQTELQDAYNQLTKIGFDGDVFKVIVTYLIEKFGDTIFSKLKDFTLQDSIIQGIWRLVPLGGIQSYDQSIFIKVFNALFSSIGPDFYIPSIPDFLGMVDVEQGIKEELTKEDEEKVSTSNENDKQQVKTKVKEEIYKKTKDIADKINDQYQQSLNYEVLNKEYHKISDEQRNNLLNKIVYTGDKTNFDENSFVVRVGSVDIKVNGSDNEPVDDNGYIIQGGWESIGWDKFRDREILWKPVKVSTPTNTNTNTNTTSPTNTSGPKDKEGVMNETIIKKGSIMNEIFKRLMEQDEEKTLKMKDWDEIFTFQKVDDKNPGKFKDVEIKMDVVMDRMPHWRKKYKKECEDLDNCDDDGEDDSFVRSVIDTHPDVVRILFTKGLAHITSSNDQEDLNEGLHGLLSLIREAKNVEVEVWSVYRHPSSPDKIWSLVKGDYKQKELASMDVKMQQSPQNSTQKKTNSLDELKKKESNSIKLLSTDEKKGIDGLPLPLKKKVREMIKKGWTTELPSSKLMKFHKEDEMKSVFGDVIRLYKLKPNEEFFNFLKDSDLDNSIKRGFCRSIYYVEKEFDLPKDKMSNVNDILGKCKNKFEGKYGQNYL